MSKLTNNQIIEALDRAMEFDSMDLFHQKYQKVIEVGAAVFIEFTEKPEQMIAVAMQLGYQIGLMEEESKNANN